MNLRIDFFEVIATIKRWEDKILGKLPFKTILTICVIVIVWHLVMAKSTIYSIRREIDMSPIRRGISRGSTRLSRGFSIGSVVSEMREQISSIESDVSEIKDDVSGISSCAEESDVDEVKSMVDKVESRLDELESDVSSIKLKMRIW